MARPLQVTDLRTWERRTQQSAHRQAIAAGHPSVYDHERERPNMPLLVATSMSVVLGMVSHVAAAVAKYGASLPLDEWQRIAGLAGSAEDARRVVAAWADGTSVDDCNPHGMVRP